MLDIVAFGRIAVGKSALLNAVFETTAFAVDVRGGTTRAATKREVRFDGLDIRIWDTPGIGEVSGADRGSAAREAASHADLVLAIFDQDPTALEYDPVVALARLGKPLLVILNKADALAPSDGAELLGQFRRRFESCVHPDNVLICAADPIRHLARESPDGRVREWSERTAPDVGRVRDRLRAVLRSEGHLLEQLDTLSREAAGRGLVLDARQQRAQQLIEHFAAGIAVGVAVNPIPLTDLFLGGAAIVAMVHQLAKNYEVELTEQEAREFACSLVSEGWKSLWPAVLPILGGSLLKWVPVAGWLMGAAGVAGGAFYLTYVFGQTCSEYFARDRQWAGSMRATLDEIIARSDRSSISRKAAELIKVRLG
jgi:small GTP-binding protein